MSWYLRSIADYDTHHGELQPDGTVAARCGIQLTPRRLPRGNLALPAHPYDHDQICPTCSNTQETR